MDQQLHVALEAEQRVLRERVEGREKDASAHKPVVHRLVLLGGIRVRNRSKSPAWREAACSDSGRVVPCLEPRLPLTPSARSRIGVADSSATDSNFGPPARIRSFLWKPADTLREHSNRDFG